MTFLISAMVTDVFSFNRERKIVILPDQQRVEWGQYNAQNGLEILQQVVMSMTRARAPSSPQREPASHGRNGGR
jgi:hypothetical protein